MYNALLGATDLEGKTFYYTNPLIGGRRTPWHACPCCVGNIPRTLLMIPTWTYVKGADSVYVNLFIGSTINLERVAGTDVQMVQKTDYPWDGRVAITVNPKQAKRFSVYVRVPDRKTSELYFGTPEVKGLKSFSVNGQSISPTIEKGYAVVTREWKAGDKIELELPMEVQRIKADEKIQTNKGLTALRYGPLIYNVERADQPNLNGVIGSQPLSTEWRSDFLQGVRVIKGTWADGTPLVAVPNYARNNRLGQEAQRPSVETAGGDSTVNYAPGSTATTTTNVTSASPGGTRDRFRESASQVWIKDGAPPVSTSP